MEILGSTQYVDISKQKESWYQLEVINMWDLEKKAVCYKYIGPILISYYLTLKTPTSINTAKIEVIEDLTEEMKIFLKEEGYQIN